MMRTSKSVVLITLAALTLAGCAPATNSVPLPTDTAVEASAPASQTDVIAEPAPSSESDQEQSGADMPVIKDPVIDSAEPLTEAEMTDVEILWEALMGADGEYAAAASYRAVLDAYGDVEPYATIYQAELRHIDALIRQLERLGVEIPANPYTGKIAAPKDLVTAAEAWAEGEVLNVALYDELISQADSEQVIKVLNNLRRASLESHLPAFELAAASGGTIEDFAGGH